MQRLNGNKFYDLAIKLHPLTEISEEQTKRDVFFLLWEARSAAVEIFDMIPLRTCKAPGQRLFQAITSVIPLEWAKAVELFSSEEMLGFLSFEIKEAAKEFETVLLAELQSMDTYLVSQKGAYSMPDLIERAEVIFPESIRARIPTNTINDIRQAGRCLAFDNPTAAAFHEIRAIESVMAIYYERVTGKQLPHRIRNWSIYLKAIRKHQDYSEQVVNFLDHIRESYRNPILHPEISVTEEEAESLLGVAVSAIRMIIREIESLELKSKSLLEPLNDLDSLTGL